MLKFIVKTNGHSYQIEEFQKDRFNVTHLGEDGKSIEGLGGKSPGKLTYMKGALTYAWSDPGGLASSDLLGIVGEVIKHLHETGF